MRSPRPRVLRREFDDLDRLVLQLMKAPMPGAMVDIERAIATFRFRAEHLKRVSMIHMEPDEADESMYRASLFYKAMDWNPNYGRDLQAYNAWMDEIERLTIELTGTANWICDLVRRDLNPMFYAIEGRLTLWQGDIFESSTWVPELSEEDRQSQPQTAMQELRDMHPKVYDP
jgi:hypothetical protein